MNAINNDIQQHGWLSQSLILFKNWKKIIQEYKYIWQHYKSKGVISTNCRMAVTSEGARKGQSRESVRKGAQASEPQGRLPAGPARARLRNKSCGKGGREQHLQKPPQPQHRRLNTHETHLYTEGPQSRWNPGYKNIMVSGKRCPENRNSWNKQHRQKLD